MSRKRPALGLAEAGMLNHLANHVLSEFGCERYCGFEHGMPMHETAVHLRGSVDDRWDAATLAGAGSDAEQDLR